jgi:3-oxosteroid 1-dehydrogenase
MATRVGVPSQRVPVIDAVECGGWDVLVDVVVAGSGGSGLVAAVMAAQGGSRVIVLEKSAHTGGTTRKSGGGVWVPCNHHMARLGLVDSREGALRYMASTAEPQLYDPASPTFGLPTSQFDLLCALVDSGGEAFETLEKMHALKMLALPDYPNYYCTIPEDVHEYGRTLGPCDALGNPVEGPAMIDQLSAAIAQRGGRIEVSHRIVSLVVDDERVVGVVADTPDGERWIHAAQAVVLATGGFTHHPGLRRKYLGEHVYGGCAAVSNEGDALELVVALGAELTNMANAWNVPIVLERALSRDPAMKSAFNIVGDRVLCVNRLGDRTMNEKTVYNEATAPMLAFDNERGEYPNAIMIAIWDQGNYDDFRGSPYDGGLMPARGDDDSHVIVADDLPRLAQAVDARLQSLAPWVKGVRLAPDFTSHVIASVDRFNELAATGCDVDFDRGGSKIERHMHRLAVNAARMGTDSGMAAMVTPEGKGWAIPVESDDPSTGNPTMAPLAATGPYYAALIVPGTLDTKGGPKVDRHGRVLGQQAIPISGLYAVGNCAGSPTGQAYWGAGGTLGPMITLAFLAGRHASEVQRVQPRARPRRTERLEHDGRRSDLTMPVAEPRGPVTSP